MARRPSATLDTERFMQRVEDKIDEALGTVATNLGRLSADVRQGNFDNALLASRMDMLEVQIMEARELALKQQKSANDARHIDEAAVAEALIPAAENAIKAGAKGVARSRWGWFVAVCLGFVALVTAAKNLGPFVREASKIVVGVYEYVIRPESKVDE